MLKITRRRKWVWALLLIMFMTVAFSKNINKVVLQETSPEATLSATIKRSLGWGILFSGSIYVLELNDLKTGERIRVIQQPEAKGWHSFRPNGIEWDEKSENIKCKWLIIQHGTDLIQTFKIHRNPLSATKTNSMEHSDEMETLVE